MKLKLLAYNRGRKYPRKHTATPISEKERKAKWQREHRLERNIYQRKRRQTIKEMKK